MYLVREVIINRLILIRITVAAIVSTDTYFTTVMLIIIKTKPTITLISFIISLIN